MAALLAHRRALRLIGADVQASFVYAGTLHSEWPERVWIWELDRQRRLCRFTAADSDTHVDLPMDPMRGTVGVAPANLEVRSALVPDAHGGNMDSPEMRAGITCYLGVNVEDALFSLGDGHARQGEGETCGVAVETAMNTVVIVDLIKGCRPRGRVWSQTTTGCRAAQPVPSRTLFA